MAYHGPVALSLVIATGAQARVFFGPFTNVDLPDVMIQLHDVAFTGPGVCHYSVALIGSTGLPADTDETFLAGRLVHDGPLVSGVPSIAFLAPAGVDSQIVIACGRPSSKQTMWIGVLVANPSMIAVGGSVSLVFPSRVGGRVVAGSGGGGGGGGTS